MAHSRGKARWGRGAIRCNKPLTPNYDTSLDRCEQQIVRSVLNGAERPYRVTRAGRPFSELVGASTDQLQAVLELIQAAKAVNWERSLPALVSSLQRMAYPLYALQEFLADQQSLAGRPVVMEEAITDDLPFSCTVDLDLPALDIWEYRVELANVRFESVSQASLNVAVQADIRADIRYRGADEAPHQRRIDVPVRFEQRIPGQFPAEVFVQGSLALIGQRLALVRTGDPLRASAVALDLVLQRRTLVLAPGDVTGVERAIDQLNDLDKEKSELEKAQAELEKVAKKGGAITGTAVALIRRTRDRLREMAAGI